MSELDEARAVGSLLGSLRDSWFGQEPMSSAPAVGDQVEFWRTCAPERVHRMPALGLSGWLAHAPHRPAEVSPEHWRARMCAWLAQDLERSAWIWSRIVLFMRARGKYLLHAQLVRAAELAQQHRNFQGETQSLPPMKNPENQR